MQLYTFPEAFGLRNVSPFCLKLEMALPPLVKQLVASMARKQMRNTYLLHGLDQRDCRRISFGSGMEYRDGTAIF